MENVKKNIPENSSLAAHAAHGLEVWSKPEVTLIEVKSSTLGLPSSTGSDCGERSGSRCT